MAEDGGEGWGAGDFVGYGGAEAGAFYVVRGGNCHCGKELQFCRQGGEEGVD